MIVYRVNYSNVKEDYNLITYLSSCLPDMYNKRSVYVA